MSFAGVDRLRIGIMARVISGPFAMWPDVDLKTIPRWGPPGHVRPQ